MAVLLLLLAGVQGLELNDSNFDDLTAAGDWFVYFYLPNSQESKVFREIWDNFGDRVKHLEVNIAQVDIEGSPQLARRLQVDSRPSLLYFSKGYFYDYTVTQRATDPDSLIRALETHSVKTSKRRRIPDKPTLLRDLAVFLMQGVEVLKQHPYQLGGIIGLAVVALWLGRRRGVKEPSKKTN